MIAQARTHELHKLLMIVVTVIAVTLFGCGVESPADQEGGGSGVAPGEIGSPCSGDDCRDGLLCFTGVPGGYCTLLCDGECEDGAVCAVVGDQSICLRGCSSDGECRDGFACAHGACRVACDERDDCLAGESCQGGVCVSDGVGAACSHPTDCQRGLACHFGMHDGYCTLECDDEPCPSGTTCVIYGGVGFCFEDCDDDDECRDGYLCNAGVCNLPCSDDAECGGGHVCVAPRCAGSGVGESCRTGSDCEGTLACYRGVDDGYCTFRCNEDRDCPVGSFCGSMKGQLWCLAACRADIDCPAGQACLDGMCTLPCESDLDCAEGYCDVDSGRCRGGGVEYVELGDMSPGTTASFHVDEGVHSFSVLIHGHPSVYYYASHLVNPDGTNLVGRMSMMGFSEPPLRMMMQQETAVVQVPNSDDSRLQVVPGTWQVQIATYGTSSPARVRVLLRRSPDGATPDGEITVNMFIAADSLGSGVNAANAADSAYMQGILSRFHLFFTEQSGISITDLRFHDLPSRYGVITNDSQYKGMFKDMSEDEALNLFFVRSISLGGQSGVLGVAGGIPGPPRLGGTYNSGALLEGQGAGSARNTGDGITHEAGHFFGLFHTSETDGRTHDLIQDTPQCNDMRNPWRSCPEAIRNLMFPSLTGMMDRLTPGQALVLRSFGGVD